jgi:hypothetical protein
MNIQEKIKQILELPDEVKKQAIKQVFGTEVGTKAVIDIVFGAYLGDKNFHYGISLFLFLESHLPKQEQDLEKIFDQNCTTSYDGINYINVEQFKQAVAELQHKFLSDEEIHKAFIVGVSELENGKLTIEECNFFKKGFIYAINWLKGENKAEPKRNYTTYYFNKDFKVKNERVGITSQDTEGFKEARAFCG